MGAGVAITGWGCISAIGTDIDTHVHSLKRGLHGIKPIRRLDTAHKNTLLAGEIPYSNDELYRMLDLDLNKAYSRTELLARHAIQQALASSAWDSSSRARTGLISATTVGGMDTTEKYYDDYLESAEHRHFIPNHASGYCAEQIALDLGIADFVTTISTACSSAANAIMLGARLIRAGKLDRVLVGGTDSLSKFTVSGFNSLRIYSQHHCKPFDKHRDGLNLGEAAAYLVLESDALVQAQAKTPLAYISGYGNANDAFHQTASSDDGQGAFQAMMQALKVADLKPADIDYINAHGTATPNNDLSEGTAIERIFSDTLVPHFSSTKAFTGHTLAAAGAVEAVFSIIALNNQAILPNYGFENQMAELRSKPTTEWMDAPIEHVLSNSLGFGGNCASLIFSRKP